MLIDDYLTVKLRRLDGSEEIELSGGGLMFVFTKIGAGACHCGPTPHRLASGDVLVVNGQSRKKFQARDREGGALEFWFFVAEIEHLFPLFSSREISLLQNVAEGFKTGRVYPGSGALAQECIRLVETAPAQSSLNHRSHLLRIVSAILTAEFNTVQSKVGRFTPAWANVLQTLPAHEFLSLSVGQLAEKFKCSRRHLNRLFHQHFGLSVAALRLEMRLLKAASLLVDPQAKIIQVAEKCGFNQLGRFNTCFKRRFGVRPSQWRRGSANEEKPAVLDAGHPSCPMHTNGLCPWCELHRGASENARTRPELAQLLAAHLTSDIKGN